MSGPIGVVQEVRELWNGFIENELDVQQEQRFDVLLKRDRQARAEYISLMNMHCTLSRYLSPMLLPGEVIPSEEAPDVNSPYEIDLAKVLALESSNGEEDKKDPDEVKEHLLFGFLQSIPGYFSNNTFQIFVLLVLLLPSVFAFLTVLNSSKHDSFATPAPMVAKAMLTDWGEESNEPIRVGSQLVEGKRYTLLSGFVELLFFNNVRVIVHGPAMFIATSYNVLQLDSGRCVAHVPPMASGFTIEANGSQIVDLGTEFGVETNANMETDIYVFKGKVELTIKDAPLDSKIELVANEGVRSSAKMGIITPIKIDTDRFIRTLSANGVLGSLPIRNASFEEPNLSGKNWIEPDGTLRAVPISYWRVGALASQQDLGDLQKNPDIGYYLWSPKHGSRFKSGVTNGNQASVLMLRDGTIEETEISKAAWIYYSFGRIRPQDVGHTLKLSVDCLARTPWAENDAKITVAFATKTSAKSCGSFVGKVGTITGADAWGRSQTVHASLIMPIEMVGRELFIVIRVEDDSPGSGEDLYLIDNLDLEHYHP